MAYNTAILVLMAAVSSDLQLNFHKYMKYLL